MIFNSLEYLALLTVVSVLHFALPHRFRWGLLLAASYLFYASWNPTYLLLILFSTAVPFVLARRIEAAPGPREKKRIVTASACISLGLLFVFKYWSFANESLRYLADVFHETWPVSDLGFLLPVGISFYTFQTLSYTIDVYRREMPAETHLGRFALYVAFFPQLVAGPIERGARLLPQIDLRKRFDPEAALEGLQLVFWGLFKKVVIADRLSLYVDAIYNNVHAHDGFSYVLATYAFAFQIYCDFSGYSDIAIGSARILGFDLMKNFETPYFSRSITEFWRRWHISLSTWLRDYLYIPLGGNRRGVHRTYLNLLITMFLGGLWHGASWNFVIWGALHGGMLAGSRATLAWRNAWHARLGSPQWLRDGLRRLITFHLVCIAWVFFRANDLDSSMTILRGLVSPWGEPFLPPSPLVHGLMALAVLLVVELVQERFGSGRSLIATLPWPARWTIWYALVFGIVLFGVDGASQFIYFQF